MKPRTLAHLAMLAAGAWLTWYGVNLLLPLDTLEFSGKWTGGSSKSDQALILLLIGLGLAAYGAWELWGTSAHDKRDKHPDA